MKTIAKLSPLALVISALCASTVATAEPSNLDQTSTFTKVSNKTLNEDDQIFYFNDASVEIDKIIDVTKTGLVESDVSFEGVDIEVQSFTQALLDNKQINMNNMDFSTETTNDAEINLINTTGNVGANTAAGDFNQQKNEVAIAVSDSPDVFQWIDAETFTYQDNEHQDVNYDVVMNVSDIIIEGGTGNIGANAASGTSNQQSNALAAAVGVAVLAEATGYIKQDNDNSNVTNFLVDNEAFLTVSDFVGNVGANVASGVGNQQANSLSVSVSRQGVGVGSIIAP